MDLGSGRSSVWFHDCFNLAFSGLAFLLTDLKFGVWRVCVCVLRNSATFA